ncbi:MAG: acetoin utilization protein AcuC, partial [Armatimonadota bacterium]
VLAGEAAVAFNTSGGLHHAMYSRASGFCIINDCVAAIYRLLESVEKVAYVDIDAHHGDGVQAAFYSNPRVLTVSIHESGRYLFPGSGFPEEAGEGEGFGYSVNVPLPPGTGDDVYIHAFDEIVPPLLSAFKPDALVTQLGADSHSEDPLAHLNVSTAAYEHAFRFFAHLGIPWVALGGGGYSVNSVSRIWTIAWFIMCRGDVPNPLPLDVCSQHGVSYLRDPMRTVSSGAVKDAVDATLQRVKQIVFPIHGF